MRREVFLEQCGNLLNTSYGTRLVFSALKLQLHHSADSFPFITRNPRMNPSVRNDFNIAVCQQEVNENAIVVFSVPDPKLGKRVYRPFACSQSIKKSGTMQRALDDEPHLADVGFMTFMNGYLDDRQGALWKRHLDPPMRHHKMPDDTFQVHGLPPSGRATTAKAAATASENIAV
ncbi:hypothetical protein SAMN05192539_102069 [Paraburkholderia diazotrophica]|uniref:Uncharacterized protein n=1 Tax=Paraburkholderia diazotrophica TaxID=667676 RepID=A0A1H7CFW8_9BURK|nr:hypothetical protein SAMN05192539_102069 [Paraburkholderia diazotrophica]